MYVSHFNSTNNRRNSDSTKALEVIGFILAGVSIFCSGVVLVAQLFF